MKKLFQRNNKSEKRDISVIVPFYNVEEYIDACLKSLTRQGDVSLEVIMVDDGSTDGSADIAKRYTDEFPNFYYYQTDNGGPGRGRNIGVKYATGKYIAFADADDIVPEYTYYKMHRLAEHTGAELTICNAERFKGKSRFVSGLHKRVFSQYEKVTHITKNHRLLYDTTSWTKLIRRDFYKEKKLAFPEGVIYEDITFSLKAHLLCNKCAMMGEVGYLWRIRNSNNKSLTQSEDTERMLKERLEALKESRKIIESFGADGLLLSFQSKILDIDLKVYINKLNTEQWESARRIADTINTYVGTTVDERAFANLFYIDKKKYELLRNNDIEKLFKLLNYTSYSSEPVREEGNKLIVELPKDLFDCDEAEITKEFANYRDDMRIDEVYEDEEGLMIAAHLLWKRLSVKMGEQKIKAYLCDNVNNIELKTEHIEYKDAPEAERTVAGEYTNKETTYDYSGAGFRIRIDYDQLKEASNGEDMYHVEVEFKNRYIEGRQVLRGVSKDLRMKYSGRTVRIGERSMEIDFNRVGEFNMRLKS